ncbi:MAG: domain containing protein, partial [Enterovirga sp.]|nr:domain containing protein [Enterovirga sp.]
ALDIGRISAEDRQEGIAELEFELRSGQASDLFDLVRSLGGAARLRIGVLTKSERGYRLAAGDEPVSVKAEPVVLRRGMSSADAFAAIVRSCIRHFRLNEPILIATRSTESLHQARVAMRRLRSALSLFGDLVADRDSEGLKRRLRTASGLLGEGRNLDVYIEGVSAQAGDPEDAAEALAAFLTGLRADRERAYDRILAMLDSPRFRRLMLDLLFWTEAGPWRTDPERRAACKRPIEEHAAELLAKRRRRVKRRGEHLDRIDPAARHEVRIDAKKLRYASEFFAGLVADGKSGRRHKTFLAALEKIQGCLGDLNDIQTAREIAADIARQAGGARAGLTREADHVEAARQDREVALLEAAVSAHEDFVAAKPFWKDFARG